jgi:hypothetical protein
MSSSKKKRAKLDKSMYIDRIHASHSCHQLAKIGGEAIKGSEILPEITTVPSKKRWYHRQH